MEHPAGGTSREIADFIGIHPRSIYRYPLRAKDLGFHVDDTPGIFRLRSEDRPKLEQVDFNFGSLEAAIFASMFQPLVEHSPASRQILQKLERAQGKATKEPLWSSPVYFPHADELPDGLYDQLVKAIGGCFSLEMDYQNSLGKINTHLVNPYLIVVSDNHFYLLAQVHSMLDDEAYEFTTFRLDQIHHCSILKGSKSPVRFKKVQQDPRAFARKFFGLYANTGLPVHVRLEVSPEKARVLERTKRHPTQRTERLPDGKLLYELQVPITPLLIGWILNYGGHIRVLEPLELRQQVVEWAQEVIKQNQ